MNKSSKPIKDHLLDYLDWLELEKGLADKSQENYSRFLKKFFDFLEINKLEKLRPRDLSVDHIWKYRLFLSRQSKKALKRSTQNHYLIALRSLLNYFTEKDILSLPPEKIKLPKEKIERTVNFLSLEQVKKLLDSPSPISSVIGLRDKAILETFFSTGLRVSELAALNREQIKGIKPQSPANAADSKKEYPNRGKAAGYISQYPVFCLREDDMPAGASSSLAKIKIKPIIKELEISVLGKGNHPRTVYFSERALDWLKKYLQKRNDKEKALFINYKGRRPATRLTVRSMERIVKKYSLLAGLPFITSCHTLRHSFATDLLMKGVDLRVIQEFLGHKNIATTQIYTHVTKPHLKEIHKKFHGLEK